MSQRALLLVGQCLSTGSHEDFLSVISRDSSGSPSFPTQNWPVSGGNFKALVILSCGVNELGLELYHNGQALASTELTLNYIPLLQTPPLHLAIMIAKDSPLLIDCPPQKRGGISSAHSDLDAAVNKFRMTAYMWQALTAEDMRVKGLGRRSFRLEEEWTTETLSREFSQDFYGSSASHMRSTAKIHLIRSEKTTAELRDAQVAQQNQQARRRDGLHDYFTAALKKHGAPFASSSHPTVAGLILDSTFSAEQNLILGHAALGCSNPSGISLGMFGSHLTYSWPRFLEEVASSLLDTAVPGDNVGNDNNECGTMWEACSIGQGAFLHEVGHAFGAPHTTGIMARGYAQDWPKNFISRTAYCSHTKQPGAPVLDGETKNDARWDLSDALSFKVLPHFRLSTDPILSHEITVVEPNVQVAFEDGQEEFLRLVISSPAQIVRIMFNQVEEAEPTIATPVNKIQFTLDELEARFERSKCLELGVLSMNGKSRVIGNIWRLFSNVSFIRVPGSSIILQKRSIMSPKLESSKGGNMKNNWDWAVLLNEKGKDGNVNRATAIDSRVGCLLDGAVVYFEDGHRTPCGPRWDTSGNQHHFGDYYFHIALLLYLLT
jgi:Putative peptidase family